MRLEAIATRLEAIASRLVTAWEMSFNSFGGLIYSFMLVTHTLPGKSVFGDLIEAGYA